MGTTSIFGLLLLFGSLEFILGAKFLLTIPKEPHYDADFTASVTAFGIKAGRTELVTLEYRGQKDRSRALNSTVLTFEADGIQTWSVMFPWERMQELDESGVQLSMSSALQEESVTLNFASTTGYIFIQTDKPIYTPRQTVKFRVIAVDEYQKLAKYHLKVDIRNDKQIIIDRMRYTAEDAFKGQEFELPKETPPGIWTITANFEGLHNTYGATHTVQFEVREYVLPRFSATVDIDADVITKETEWITATVKAKYVYGRPVVGIAEMQLGVWDHRTGVKLFPQRYTQELVNGEYKQDIRVGFLFPDNESFPQDKRLYVNVNVTESATLENDTVEDTSTFIAHPYYVVEFKSSKRHFKPGFPYTLQAQVRAQSGTPARWVWLWVQNFFYDGQRRLLGSDGQYFNLNDDGLIKRDFDIPANVHAVTFYAVVVDPKRANYQSATLEVTKYDSPNNEYIHVSLTSPISKYRDGVVLLRYTPPRNLGFLVNANPDQITVQVMAKGQVIHSTSTVRNSDGRSNLKLPKQLYHEATPSMRVIAYYHVHANDEVEFVVDSLLVDTPHVCLEEIYLDPPGGMHSIQSLYKPKDSYKLDVTGGPYMRIGFVAVDKAVFLLNDKQTLTRESMFTQLGSHDQGVDGGDGSNLREILMNSGLSYMLIDSDRGYERPSFGSIEAVKEEGPDREHLGDIHGVKSSLENAQHMTTHDRPQSVRNYFPESWLFEETILPRSGRLDLNLTLPDSITTWSFLAVGLSSTRGVCVSRPLEQEVTKLFFADVRLPYKVTRLEEVKVKIAVYNFQTYAIKVSVVVSGSEGLCFSANTARGSTQNSTSFMLDIEAGRTAGETVKVIPLKNGDLTLRVDLQNQHERDIVERKLYVVAEGLRVKKSITFVLDPEAKHATYKRSRRHKVSLSDTTTVNNLFDLKNKEQQTVIDMALPTEVIRGTETCRIAAFGDLMGDIINHAVIQSKSLMDQSLVNAEEVLGDLSPTVHALLYANQSGLMYEELSERGKRFVRHGVSRLLKYKKDDYFTLTPESKPATWLTAFVLKTLCHASSLTFVDKRSLIDRSFNWLWTQVDENGTLNEQDWQLAQDSFEYKLMLSAEVLIAILECERSEQEGHLTLQADMAFFLEDNLHQIKQPMVLAKVTYALMLFDPRSESVDEAVKRLVSLRQKNKLGQYYWSDVEREDDESKKTPFWYYQGVKASSIEATAYALLVFLEKGGTNVDAIADWLVAQRSHNGAFIGAMDSSAAIQALSLYSLQKHGLEVDLYCNVSTDRLKEHFHAFKFTEQNATSPESLYNVPVGQKLEVLTRGQGLGQMQVNVEYNIPIDKNARCAFDIDIRVNSTLVRWMPDMYSNPLCSSCNIGCVKEENKTANASTPASPVLYDLDAERVVAARVAVQVDSAVKPATARRRPAKARKPTAREGRQRKGERRRNQNRKRPSRRRDQNEEEKSPLERKTRDIRAHPAASKKSICIHICLQHLENGPSGPTTIEIEMLTGYRPVTGDVERIKAQENVRNVEYLSNSEKLLVQFTQISNTEKTCVALRAVDEEEVGRQTSATVVVQEMGNPKPSCVKDYDPVLGQESLQVYCADFANINRGECRCFSGLCSSCGPMVSNEFDLHSVRQLACKAPIAYQLQLTDVKDQVQWVEIDARVVSQNKTGIHPISDGDIIKMMTPSSCHCPIRHFGDKSESFYMLSADVEKMVDRHGNEVYRYLLDEQSVFLRVTDPQRSTSPRPAVDFIFLQNAFSPNNKCSP